MSNEIFLIDTNILVYAYDSTEKQKQQKALQILELCFGQRTPFAVCLQNISEFFFVVTNKIQHPIEESTAEILVKDFLNFSPLIKLQYNQTTLLKAISLSKECKIDYWDALIAATMIENNFFSIYTENVIDFRKVSAIKTINPFTNSLQF